MNSTHPDLNGVLADGLDNQWSHLDSNGVSRFEFNRCSRKAAYGGTNIALLPVHQVQLEIHEKNTSVKKDSDVGFVFHFSVRGRLKCSGNHRGGIPTGIFLEENFASYILKPIFVLWVRCTTYFQ